MYGHSRSKRYKQIMLIQKLLGLIFLIISALIIYIALHGVTMEERDVTAVFITIPLGLVLVFVNKKVLDI